MVTLSATSPRLKYVYMLEVEPPGVHPWSTSVIAYSFSLDPPVVHPRPDAILNAMSGIHPN